MKEIQLTQGKVALVDDADYEALSQYRWYAFPDKRHSTFYAARNSSTVNGKRHTVRMHRQILGLDFGYRCEVDHQDGDGLNNQRHNLRGCSRQENNRNMRMQIRSKSSRFKGVHKNGKFWHVQISRNNQRKYLGLFRSETEAALAYNSAAAELFGEFARLNVVGQ
jgi:HNH endonuclease